MNWQDRHNRLSKAVETQAKRVKHKPAEKS